MSRKVFVGLSGGVDSSVSAALLKKAGYKVTGVFIKVWQPDFLPCSWREERRDAMRVAAKLGIPFLTFDLEKEYKRDVVDYMIREYRAGRTPNPDVMCNKYVKFGAFFKRARKLGADYVATGHYSRVEKLSAKSYQLKAAIDTEKDQSYFLWNLNQEILSKTFFPVGGYKKSEVRALAKKFDLFTSDKKDSQGLCFVGKLDMKEFLSHYIKSKQGKVLNEVGETIGSHDGACFFAPGERHGFTVFKKSPNDEPLYVVDKDMSKNTITVGTLKIQSSKSNLRTITLSETNWVSGKAPIVGKKYRGRPRYRAQLVDVTIKKIRAKRATLALVEKDINLVPGQSFVLYEGAVCLGGGIIN